MRRKAFIYGTLAAVMMPKMTFASLPRLIVHRTQSCGCCGKWVKKMAASGFAVEESLLSYEALVALKSQLGIAEALSSCHTATIEGYVIEGHVPAEDVTRLLAQRPQAIGLSVPGMPIGSPGMEMGDEKEPYETLLIQEDGTITVFNRHG